MINKFKQARKLLLSFGFECKNGYCNARYIGGRGYFYADKWSYNSTNGQFTMEIHTQTQNGVYTEHLPSILSTNQNKMCKLVKDLKRLKQLWFDCFEESYKDKLICSLKAEKALQEDFA